MFQLEKITPELIQEFSRLIQLHFNEIAHYPDIPLDPDFNRYSALDHSGVLRVFTIREEGKLLGYSIFVVGPNLHYKSSKQAVQDILYLDPEKRGRLVGYQFIKWCDEQLKVEEVQVVYHHIKANYDFGPMLERIGYELIDKIYGRRLDR